MDVVIVMIAATVAGLLLLWLAARAAITVCVAEVRDGRIEVTRGGIAPTVLADLGDVIAHPPIQRATLRIVRSQGAAELQAHGDLSPAQLQRIRNVIGSVPLAKLVNARARPRR
jgi:hypothetical protein